MIEKNKIEGAIVILTHYLHDAEARLNSVHATFGDLVARANKKYDPSLVEYERMRLERRATFYKGKPHYKKQLEETLLELSALPVPETVIWPEDLLKERLELEKEIEDIKGRIGKLESYLEC